MAYFERIWMDVPDGVEPEHFALRRGFLLERVRAGERVLDLGCGAGAFSAALAEAGARSVGAEVAAEPLRRAAARHPQLEFHLVGERELPFEAETFDAVWLGEVLEHVQDVVGLLGEVNRVLRPRGRLLLSTPDHPLRLRLGLALSRRRFEAHFDPRSDHVRFFTRGSLERALEDAGFGELETRARDGVLLASALRP